MFAWWAVHKMIIFASLFLLTYSMFFFCNEVFSNMYLTHLYYKMHMIHPPVHPSVCPLDGQLFYFTPICHQNTLDRSLICSNITYLDCFWEISWSLWDEVYVAFHLSWTFTRAPSEASALWCSGYGLDAMDNSTPYMPSRFLNKGTAYIQLYVG